MELKNSLELLSQEYEKVQNDLSRAQEDLELKEKAIKELKRSVGYLVGGDRRDKSKELEKQLLRLGEENDQLRQHVLQLQRVFQERESELLAELEGGMVHDQHEFKK